MPLLALCRLEFLGGLCWGEFGSYHLIRASSAHSRKGLILSSECHCLIAFLTSKPFNL